MLLGGLNLIIFIYDSEADVDYNADRAVTFLEGN